MKILLCADKSFCILIENRFLLERRKYFDSQRVSAFRISYYDQNQVLTKEMIMENIWGIDSEFIDSNTISVMISRLKKKLNDSSNVYQ